MSFHQEETRENNSTPVAGLMLSQWASRTIDLKQQQQHENDNQTTVDVQQVLLVALLISLILISVVGNCLVCVAIFTDRRLRKLGNAFIVSLAIADLFVSCLVMTFALCNDLMNQWIFGDWFCDVWISFDIMCCTASILNLCAISLDRFIHIKDCLLYNQWMTRRIAISAVMGIWFISALVSFVPINLGWHRPPVVAEPGQLIIGSSYSSPSSAASQPGQLPLAAAALALDGKFDYRRIANVSSGADGQLAERGAENEPSSGSLSAPPAASTAAAAAAADQQQQQQRRREAPKADLPQCMLALTPTYAVISSTISFYIPCIIMLGLYTKLFACARKHVKNIQAISKAPAPLTVTSAPQNTSRQNNNNNNNDSRTESRSVQDKQLTCTRRKKRHRVRVCGRAWLRFRTRRQPQQQDDHTKQLDAQAIDDKLILRSSAAATAASNQLTKADSGARGTARTSPEQAIRGTGYNVSGQRQQLATSLLARQEQSRLEEENELTQQLTLDQIEAPQASNIISSGQLFVQEQSRPFLPQQAGQQKEQQQQQQQQKQRQTTLAGLLKRSDSWRQSSSSTREQLRLKRDQVRTTSFNSAASQQQQQRGQQLATHKAAVTLGIIMGTFLFCWVPFFCLNIIKAFCVDCIPSSLFRAFTWLGYANSALNPIIYGIHNSEFRNAFNRIFFKHLNIKNSRYYLNRRFSAYDMRFNNNNNNNNHHNQHQQQQQQQQQQRQQPSNHNHMSTTNNSFAALRHPVAASNHDEALLANNGANKSDTVT